MLLCCVLSDEDNKVILGCSSSSKTHPLSNTLFMKTELLSTMVVVRRAGELHEELQQGKLKQYSVCCCSSSFVFNIFSREPKPPGSCMAHIFSCTFRVKKLALIRSQEAVLFTWHLKETYVCLLLAVDTQESGMYLSVLGIGFEGSNRLKGAYITYLFFYIIRSGIECIEARK